MVLQIFHPSRSCFPARAPEGFYYRGHHATLFDYVPNVAAVNNHRCTLTRTSKRYAARNLSTQSAGITFEGGVADIDVRTRRAAGARNLRAGRDCQRREAVDNKVIHRAASEANISRWAYAGVDVVETPNVPDVG
jgi:hypothetical protein